MTEIERLGSAETKVAELKSEVRAVLETVRDAVLDMEAAEMGALFNRADEMMSSPLYQ